MSRKQNIATSLIATIFLVVFSTNAFGLPSGNVTVGLSSDPSILDVHKGIAGNHMHFHINTFEGLYNRNWKGELVPGIAISHTVKDNGLTYVFELRKNAKFHNGDKVTAEDVKFSYDRARNPNTKCPWASWWKNLETVEVLGPYTVAFHWNKPNAAFINQTTWLNAGAIVPKKYIEKVGDQGFSKKPVGSGPFKFVSYKAAENLVIEAFGSYWGKTPEVKTIEFKFIPELGARLSALKTGEIDIMQQIPPFEAESLKSNPEIDVVTAPNGEVFFYTMHSIQNPIFRDVRVRRAFNYAVNKKNIADKIFRGYVSVANSYVAPSLTGYDPDLPGYPYNPEKAKKLLIEANYKWDTPINITIARGRWTMNEEAALAIASDLVAVGINARLQFMEYSEWVSRLRPKNLGDMTNLNRSNSAWDAEGSLLASLKSNSSYSYWNNSPELDAMIDELSTIYDVKKRAEQFKKIFHKTWEEAPVLFLWEFHDIWGKSERITWEMGPGERWAHFLNLRMK